MKNQSKGSVSLSTRSNSRRFISMNNIGIKQYDKEVIGGKALGLLGLMYLEEVKVPDFFIVPSSYFDIVNKENNLLQMAEENSRRYEQGEVDEYEYEVFSMSFMPNLNKIQSQTINTLSEEILKQVSSLRWHDKIIIRSSCNLEDNENMPLAGVFESFVVENPSVTEVTKAINAVFASAYTVKSQMYLRKYNLSFKDIKMSLIVQNVPKNIEEKGSVFISGDMVVLEKSSNIFSDNMEQTMIFEYKSAVGNPILDKTKSFRSLGYKNYTIEYVKTPKELYLVQMRHIPDTCTDALDDFSCKSDLKKIYEEETKSINFGNACGHAFNLSNIDKNTDISSDAIIVANFTDLYRRIKENTVNINNEYIKGYIILCDNIFFHLSLLSKELFKVPVAFVKKDFSYLQGKDISLSVGNKSRIYEKI